MAVSRADAVVAAPGENSDATRTEQQVKEVAGPLEVCVATRRQRST